MIKRYSRPAMASIWSDKNKYKLWLQVEILACEAQAKLGLVPQDALDTIKNKAKIDVARIEEIEEKTKHDVIAFISSIEEYVGEASRFVHLGMTSSDVLDTALAVQIKQAGDIILEGMNKLSNVLKKRALEFKQTVCIGRSHGIHAEPITFGLKFALWYEECKRNIKRIQNALEDTNVGMISGAVGTYEHLSPKVEEYVCEKLGLKPVTISTQVIQRDAHAAFISALAIAATLLEKIATEIRHLQRTEVLEAEEYFSPGQKGSSAMPHKRNPISSENICGQARLLRSYSIAAIEDNVLWHERDISHSSVERIILPDATVTFDYILARTTNIVDNLIVYPERMKQNMDITKGLYASQKVLLQLVNKGLKRQEAYESVQKSAMRTWKEKIPFMQTLLENPSIMQYLTKQEIEKLFSFDEIFKNVDYIYKRCGIL
ncbi:MAG: adenylosuccinate lyase [Bacteroidetes bacterium]|nr:adenylosuccinate lyase [Bacteroidota bacterium]MBR3090365.1 adenylosuccinate lyase [Bacteroidota bacterium]